MTDSSNNSRRDQQSAQSAGETLDVETAAAAPKDMNKVAYYEASQWKLMWRRFRKHKMALWSLHFLIVIYVLFLNCDFFAPNAPDEFHTQRVNMPPQVLYFGFVDGNTLPGFYVHPFIQERHPVTLKRLYSVDETKRVPIRFFVRGRTWRFMGLFETNLHFFGVDKPYTSFLLGSDSLGQDMFSRILYGGRISLLLGLVGVLLTFVLGITLGGISGYYGGRVDMVIQRIAEMLQYVPKIPIWLAMAAAIPKNWTPLTVYFAMTMILACMVWTGLCRVVRGKLLSLREEDYARAAVISGATPARVIFVHLVPNFFSHIIASLTLAIPAMILAETSLSFLGLGLKAPITSWGVLLKEAQRPGAVLNHPWLLLPAVMVILTVLTLNYAGEGLRDAADPYAT